MAHEKFVRQLPGRIAGETVDQDGRLAYVHPLRGREQDIRRAKGNSNICTNQALTALAATVYAALMGPEGCARSPSSPSRRLIIWQIGFRLRASGYGTRRAVLVGVRGRDARRGESQRGFARGRDRRRAGPGDGAMLVAVTEKRTRQELDAFVEVVSNAG